MNYVLYNHHSGKGLARDEANNFLQKSVDEAKLVDMTEIDSYSAFFASLSEGDCVYIFGGDGTLNRFVNLIGDEPVKNKIYYYPAGTGNDFFADFGKAECEPMLINEYIENLPTVEVNGEIHKFINGVGYGIDGYCCEVGDKLKAKAPDKPVNYTSIAVKGVLFAYKPCDAVVTVDGVEHSFKKVWLAPTMFGGHYGGGMIPTPGQARDSEEKTVSVMIFSGSGRLKTLMMFPSIFKGEHIKYTKHIALISGKEITVKFSRPTPLQIDGETVLGVTEYKAKAPAAVAKKV